MNDIDKEVVIRLSGSPAKRFNTYLAAEQLRTGYDIKQPQFIQRLMAHYEATSDNKEWIERVKRGEL